MVLYHYYDVMMYISTPVLMQTAVVHEKHVENVFYVQMGALGDVRLQCVH